MKTEITLEEAKKLYVNGSQDTQNWLIEKFGTALINKSNNYIQLWDEFLKKNKLNIALPFSMETTEREEQRTNAFHMLTHIVPVERGNFEPDYSDENQYKYEPRFYMGSSGFAFEFSYSNYWSSGTAVGSRLCTPSSKECERIAKKYLAVYEILLTK